MASLSRTFATGSIIPQSGIYAVIHSAHRLPHEVTLIQGEIFPRCAKCSQLVTFTLIRAVLGEFQYERLRIYELPVLEDEDAAAAGAAE